MDYGIAISATDKSIRPDDLAKLAEERGFESISFAEHTHIPTNRRTPMPAGGDMPEFYKRTYDTFLALTAAAMVTTRIKLWYGRLPRRHSTTRSRWRSRSASLDVLSRGAASCLASAAVGTQRRWRTTALRFASASPVLRERVLAMARDLAKTEAPEFHGKYVDFDPIWSFPEPVQKPHPPIFMGGDGPTTLIASSSSATVGCPAAPPRTWMPHRISARRSRRFDTAPRMQGVTPARSP